MIVNTRSVAGYVCPILSVGRDAEIRCLGCECMLWRYAHCKNHVNEDDGYCGLAGKPEYEL